MFKLALGFVLVLSFSQLSWANKKTKEVKTPAMTSMKLDAAQSKVTWAGTKKIGGGHNGEVAIQSGEISLYKNLIKSGEIVIDLSKLTVTDIPATDKDNAKLVGHLQSEDFFDVKKFPTAKLIVKSSKEVSPGKLEVTADLIIKDVTQSMTFPVEMKMENGKAVATGKLNIDRTKFGVKYGSANFFKLAADRVINDNFELGFTAVAQ